MYAPNSNGIIGDTVRAASPQLAYRIGQEFKRKDQEGSAQHLLAHAILGAAVSYATGNNITTGALSGAGSEVAAPALANYLYGTNEPSELNQEQKDTIVSILNLATVTTAYTATDGNTTDAVSAAEIGKVGVEWNADTIRLDGKDAHDRAFEAEAKRLFPDNPELQQQYIAQQNKKNW
ncbi:VENN motif pre-toxin domain-containing protein [Moraxella nonliquefaciens]|uniref:VENN motif pre-toxin domain-containing protein n=1 Tax=Moraxella nonliquefaciens TaxID=478 RepID=UPI003EE020DC